VNRSIQSHTLRLFDDDDAFFAAEPVGSLSSWGNALGGIGSTDDEDLDWSKTYSPFPDTDDQFTPGACVLDSLPEIIDPDDFYSPSISNFPDDEVLNVKKGIYRSSPQNSSNAQEPSIENLNPTEATQSAPENDAFQEIEAAIVCKHCGSAGIRVGIDRPPYRYVCGYCRSPATGALVDLLTQARGHVNIEGLKSEQAAEVKLFLTGDIRARVQSGRRGEEGDVRILEFLAKLIATGQRRPLYRPPEHGWAEQLDALKSRHPNFDAVIEQVVRPMIAIRAAGGRSRPVPILLLGEPGVGKTHFARALAAFMQVPSMVVDFSSAQTNATLAGSASFWSNSSPGELTQLLAFGSGSYPAHADPLVFIDEVDKLPPDMKYDPMGPLYQLLEVDSARHFVDLALPGIRLDASNVVWVLAANSVERVPAPLLSRVRVFEIDSPSDDEKDELLRRIFQGMVCDTSLPTFSGELPHAISVACRAMGLREFKNIANAAIGRALLDGRGFVAAQDFEPELSSAKPKGQPRPIGFI
jgi:hypothetical protein